MTLLLEYFSQQFLGQAEINRKGLNWSKMGHV